MPLFMAMISQIMKGITNALTQPGTPCYDTMLNHAISPIHTNKLYHPHQRHKLQPKPPVSLSRPAQPQAPLKTLSG